MTVEYTTKAKPKVEKELLKFGATTSDHMLEVDWDAQKGWHAPRIVPYQPLQIDPAASVLHYGLEVGERSAATERPRPLHACLISRSLCHVNSLPLCVCSRSLCPVLRGYEGLFGR